MRLLNIKTRKLESFENWDTVPPYAILSHTWEEGEVLFDDITNGSALTKPGWSKIRGACAEAEKLGIFYVWVDTCCIFKESSAELSESINSMFAWYRDARICFAYIGDLDENTNEGTSAQLMKPLMATTFEDSKWWTRGWTLQELIAPTEVMFFNKNWNFIDLRSSLTGRIAKITGIAEEILKGGNLHKLHDFSTAEKFSWASERRTTRGEDRAYSLMGLFGVNMSMIYGEGEQAAFFRLQKEIFAVYADHSIFAWHYPSQTNQEMKTCHLLASSVSAFKSSADIVSEPYPWDIIGRPRLDKVKVTSSSKPLAKYSAISHGMLVQMLVATQYDNYYIAYLACRFRANNQTLLGFMVEFEPRTGEYRRASHDEIKQFTVDSYFGSFATLQDVYVAAPRLDFALSHRPVRYQIGDNHSVLSPHESFLCLMDEAVRGAGFTQIDYSPPAVSWGLPQSNPDEPVSPGLRLWHHDKDSSVLYRNKKTRESFTVVIGASKKFRDSPEAFLAAVVDDMGEDTSAAEILDDFFQHNSHSLTDLSTQMLVKHLSSGKQVILSVNVGREWADAKPLAVGWFQKFSLWVVVKEGRI